MGIILLHLPRWLDRIVAVEFAYMFLLLIYDSEIDNFHDDLAFDSQEWQPVLLCYSLLGIDFIPQNCRCRASCSEVIVKIVMIPHIFIWGSWFWFCIPPPSYSSVSLHLFPPISSHITYSDTPCLHQFDHTNLFIHNLLIHTLSSAICPHTTYSHIICPHISYHHKSYHHLTPYNLFSHNLSTNNLLWRTTP